MNFNTLRSRRARVLAPDISQVPRENFGRRGVGEILRTIRIYTFPLRFAALPKISVFFVRCCCLEKLWMTTAPDFS